MKLKNQIMTPLIAVFTYSGIAVAAEPPNGQELLRRAEDALGGATALSAVEAFSFQGEGVAFRLPARFDVSLASDGRKSASIATKIYQLERTSDGDIGWERQRWEGVEPYAPPHIRQLNPDVFDRFERAALFLPILQIGNDASQAETVGQELVDGKQAYQVRVRGRKGNDRVYSLDAETYLPVELKYTAKFESGTKDIVATFSDYRQTGALTLPYQLTDVEFDYPDQGIKINVSNYAIGDEASLQTSFPHPNHEDLNDRYQFRLETAPSRIYKEHDYLVEREWDGNPSWAWAMALTESWTMELLLDERQGRWAEPESALVEIYASGRLVRSVEFSADELKLIRRSKLARYSGIGSVSVFRHHFTAPAALEVDRMDYKMTLRDQQGRRNKTSLRIPLLRNDQKTEMIFPVRGNFIATSAHDYDDPDHKDEWGQWGAYDIIVLGPKFEALKTAGPGPYTNDVSYTFGAEVLAPADGVVVYSRSEIPDETPPNLLLQGLSDPMWLYPGNSITIDHGNGEFSFFCHLQQNSVMFKKGDRVKQGDVIARIGATQTTGVPHLHFQLMDGPQLLRASGLPSRFINVETAYPRPGTKVETPKYGVYLRTNDKRSSDDK